jgi:ComF family protein
LSFYLKVKFLQIYIIFKTQTKLCMKPAVLFKDFLALFYPRTCNACGKTLVSDEECICTFCQYHLPKTQLHLEQENKLTQVFWGRVSIVTGTALYYYQKGGKVQHLIHQFKYRGKTDVGEHLGEVLGRSLRDTPLYSPLHMVVPIPLHPAKKHKRGFNQSEVFGRGIARAMDIPLVTDALLRVTATTTQTRKARFRRWENVESVFHVARPQALENKNILLVDDVVTTGSTLEASAQKLLAVPGTRIWIATIAMTV